MYDTIIIGSGPAGMTAGIYAARRGMKALIIGKELGGQIIWASEIENYPGFKSISNFDLINKMQEQVKALGVDIKTNEVKKIEPSCVPPTDVGRTSEGRPSYVTPVAEAMDAKRASEGKPSYAKALEGKADKFVLWTDKDKFEAKTIILAIGLLPRCLDIPGEKEFIGKGVSYCANCDGPFYKDKIIAVAGGGNSALDAAEFLSKIAKKVYVIHRREEFRAFKVLINEIKDRHNIELVLDSDIKEIIGDLMSAQGKLKKIKVFNNRTNQESELAVDGLFIEIGRIANTDLVADLVKRDKYGQIIVNERCQTSLPGIFAAGDVTQVPFKQITIACGQATIAALSAYEHIQLK